MLWQDTVISIANIFFSISLAIQVYCGFKEKTGPIKHATSIPTFLGLFAMSFAYWTLGLLFSSAITSLVGFLWFILFAQRLIYNKK